MKKFLACLLLTTLVLSIGVGMASSRSEAIVGGTATNKSWAVAFIKPGSQPIGDRVYCSGVLLSSRVVATARHCISEIQRQKMAIVIGRGDLAASSTGSVRYLASTSAVRNAPGYYRPNKPTDLSLVKLNNLAPQAALPLFASTALRAGDDVYPYGYGPTSTRRGSPSSRYLRRTTLRVNLIENRFIATWDCRGIVPGDSGGAATKYVNGKEYLAGISSQTYLLENHDQCRGGGYGAVFAKVTPDGSSRAVYDWVKKYRNGW